MASIAETLDKLNTGRLPYTYRRFRLPKPAPPEVGEGLPGHLCWGQVGTISAEPTIITGWNVVSSETHSETGRTSEQLRIENPDDPTQYIDVARAKQIKFDKQETKPKANIKEEIPPGISSYENLSTNFVPTDGKAAPTKVTVNYYGPGNVAGSTGPGNIVPGPPSP